MHPYVADHRTAFLFEPRLEENIPMQGSLPRVDSHKVSGHGD